MAYCYANKRTKWPFLFTTKDNSIKIVLGIIMTLKETRLLYNLSQKDATDIVGVPIRTFRRYEYDEQYGNALKRQMFINLINNHCEITEEKGLLTIEQIKILVTELLDSQYKGQVDFCYLFGSYAKGCPKENSDVDLYVSTSLTGFGFVGLIERLRQKLHKKVDLIRSSELNNNIDLVNEIMKGGIKIYG